MHRSSSPARNDITKELGGWIKRRSRSLKQRNYRVGDRVEILANEADICRTWYAGEVVDCFGPDGLSNVYRNGLDYEQFEKLNKKRNGPRKSSINSHIPSRNNNNNSSRNNNCQVDTDHDERSRSDDEMDDDDDDLELDEDMDDDNVEEDQIAVQESRHGNAGGNRSVKNESTLPTSTTGKQDSGSGRTGNSQRHDRATSTHSPTTVRSPIEDSVHEQDHDLEPCTRNEVEDVIRVLPSLVGCLIGGLAYAVRMEHMEHVEEVEHWRMRPAPPVITVGEDGKEWKPEMGEAVEVLHDSAWTVGVVQNFVFRKGHLISLKSGDAKWFRRPEIRPYQIWRGGSQWVRKLKPPLPLVRKSVGLSVTQPPGGKRKRAAWLAYTPTSGIKERVENGLDGTGFGAREDQVRARPRRYGALMGEVYETRVRKRRRLYVDQTGPDGLPGGWSVDYHDEQQRSSGERHGKKRRYVAPDGRRLKSLKEAHLYVRMMGPA